VIGRQSSFCSYLHGSDTSFRTESENFMSKQPEIKFIFISGYTANIMDLKGMQQAGLEFVMKPFSKNEILGKVREVLDMH